MASGSASGCSTAPRSSIDGAAELIAALRLRVGLPGLHRSASRAGRRRQGTRPAAARARSVPTAGGAPPARAVGSIDAPGSTPPGRPRRARDAGSRAGRTAGPRDAARRSLARRRARRRTGGSPSGSPSPSTASGSAAPAGGYVRVESPPLEPAGRSGPARPLPDSAPPDVPLVCLDTETTGLATGPGTVAFLVGLGWWEGDRFRQVQLLLPDHAEEPALLDALAAAIPADAWLVTYNGRGFDWPLLETRYRMARRPAPAHAGHLDLLPFVRRIFRHRLADARLRTVEAELLGLAPGRRRRRLGDPGPLPRLPGRRAGRRRSPRSSATTTQDVRSLAPAARACRGPLGAAAERRSGAGRRPGRACPGVRAASAGRTRRSTASTWPSRRRPAARRRAGRGRALPDDARRRPGRRTPADRHDREALLGGARPAPPPARSSRRGPGDVARPGLGGGQWARRRLDRGRQDPASIDGATRSAPLEACGRADRIAERARFLGQRLPQLEADLSRRRRRLRSAHRPGSRSLPRVHRRRSG